MFLDEKKGLTHDVLTTFLAEACAIINSRPITPVSNDPDDPTILTPATLLTRKTDNEIVPFDSISLKDMYRTSWKHVQGLSDVFWKRWRESYIQNLQKRRKWQEPQPNLKEGDVVLMRDYQTHRNHWPLAVVLNAIKSEDGLVRKVVVRASVDNKNTTYTRPVCELVLLVD